MHDFVTVFISKPELNDAMKPKYSSTNLCFEESCIGDEPLLGQFKQPFCRRTVGGFLVGSSVVTGSCW